MHSRTVGIGLLLAMVGVTSAMAEDSDSAEGQKLYNKECSVCHGLISHTNTSDAAPVRSRLRPVRVAVAPSAEFTAVDFQIPLSSDWRESGAGHESRRDRTTSRDLLAVVPLYGPPLGGVLGRPAGTYSGYSYSKAFLQKMEGVTWDEARLDAWITSSQTMVPGSFMFYSLKKPDPRSKIILYLKAPSQ